MIFDKDEKITSLLNKINAQLVMYEPHGFSDSCIKLQVALTGLFILDDIRKALIELATKPERFS